MDFFPSFLIGCGGGGGGGGGVCVCGGGVVEVGGTNFHKSTAWEVE